MCGEDCMSSSSLFGTSGRCLLNSTVSCLCPDGYSGVDYWSPVSDCHVNEEFLRGWHAAVLAVYLLGLLVSLGGLLVSLKSDFVAFHKAQNKKKKQESKEKQRISNLAKSKTKSKEGSQQSIDLGTKKSKESSIDNTDYIQEVPTTRERQPTFFSSLNQMLRQKAYFKMGRLFTLHLVFHVLGAVYLGMTLGGTYRFHNNVVQNLALSIAASAMFAGLWEVVLIWHKAIPRALVGRAEKRRMSKSLSKDNLPVGVESPTWQASLLVTMSGSSWMVYTLLLVFASVIVSVQQIGSDSSGLGYDIFEWLTFLTFFIELGVRMYCWNFVKRQLRSFFKDRFHNLDVLVVLLDIIIIAITIVAKEETAGEVGGFTRMLRGVRFFKLLRILRAARLMNIIGSKSLLHSEVRVRTLVNVHSCGGLLWFMLSGFALPLILDENTIGDRLLMFGMFVTVTDFVFAMIIICVDIKRMLDDVLGSTASEENKKIFVQADFKRKVTLAGILSIGPTASIFTLLLSTYPVFTPDGSFWFSLCAVLAALWNMLITLVVNRGKLKWKKRGAENLKKSAVAPASDNSQDNSRG